MIRQFLDWLSCLFFGREGYGYKCSPIEKSILRVLGIRKGLLAREVQAQINYVDIEQLREFEKILERLETVGLVRYKEGEWFRMDRRYKKDRRVEKGEAGLI